MEITSLGKVIKGNPCSVCLLLLFDCLTIKKKIIIINTLYFDENSIEGRDISVLIPFLSPLLLSSSNKLDIFCCWVLCCWGQRTWYTQYIYDVREIIDFFSSRAVLLRNLITREKAWFDLINPNSAMDNCGSDLLRHQYSMNICWSFSIRPRNMQCYYRDYREEGIWKRIYSSK